LKNLLCKIESGKYENSGSKKEACGFIPKPQIGDSMSCLFDTAKRLTIP
jgi:hypothetical protein